MRYVFAVVWRIAFFALWAIIYLFIRICLQQKQRKKNQSRKFLYSESIYSMASPAFSTNINDTNVFATWYLYWLLIKFWHLQHETHTIASTCQPWRTLSKIASIICVSFFSLRICLPSHFSLSVCWANFSLVFFRLLVVMKYGLN